MVHWPLNPLENNFYKGSSVENNFINREGELKGSQGKFGCFGPNQNVTYFIKRQDFCMCNK